MEENNIFEEFEKFWILYPKKVWKKPCFVKFKRIPKKEYKNLFNWLDLYIKKWEKEKTQKRHIPNPLTFLNQERYYDEIYIDERKKDINIRNIKIIKEEEKEKKEIKKTKDEIITFFKKMKKTHQEILKNKTKIEIIIKFPKTWEKEKIRLYYYRARMNFFINEEIKKQKVNT